MIKESAYRIRPWKSRGIRVVVKEATEVYDSDRTSRILLAPGEHELKEIPNPFFAGGPSWFVNKVGQGCIESEWQEKQETGKVVIR